MTNSQYNQSVEVKAIDPNMIYTIEQLMFILKGARKSVYREIKAGKLKTFMRGRRRLCTGQQIINYRKLVESEA